jgi:hypothetical protein
MAKTPKDNPNTSSRSSRQLPAGMRKISTSFVSSYWSPTEDGSFYGKVVRRELREEAKGNKPAWFHYIIQALEPTECRTGKATDGETVTVQPGEEFAVTELHNLTNLRHCIGYTVQVTVVEKVPTKGGNDVWVLEVLSDAPPPVENVQGTPEADNE